MNETIKTQLNHRTIRKFENRPVEKEALDTLLEVVNRTASSTGMQNSSIIRVTDKDLREKIYEISTQKYLLDVPELWIFVVDTLRNDRIARENGFEPKTSGDMDKFFQGFTDATLAIQNLTIAIESMGMGAVYFGSILNNMGKLVEALKLPKLVFPVLGIGFGYPKEEPQLKPRMPMELKFFENEYKILPSYKEAIKEYDEEMTNYYDLRENGKRSDIFSEQVVARLKPEIEVKRNVADILELQGFNLRLEREKK